MRVFVTGMGVISSIGVNVNENLKALQQGRTGIKPISGLSTIHRGKWPAAEIDLTNTQLLNLIPNFNQETRYTRGQLLTIIAANEAIAEAKLSIEEQKDMAIVGGNTVGGIDITEANYRDYQTTDPYYFNQAHPGGETTRQLADYLHTSAFTSTINTACSSSANAIILGTRLIKNGRAKRVLVGGSDPLTKFSLNGFASLMIYDEENCKPFDARHQGLNLGEGGAFLVLESEDVLGKKDIYAEVLGYANRNDAFHSSASSPDGEGAYATIKQALKEAALMPEQISFVHAHGTATPNNDTSEGEALKRIFKTNIPPFASSKSYVGHTLGAAGALNAIYAILAMKYSFLFPNLNFKEAMDEQLIPILKVKRNINLSYVLSNAFGFGGNNTSIVFGKVNKGGDNE